MISFVRGHVWERATDYLIVDIGPTGMRVACTPATATRAQVGDQILLHTSLIVREDSWTLFGFDTTEERQIFDLVQTVSGIGPRIALAVLASLSPAELSTAIATEDLTALTSVSGIGKKGASRMVLELKDKLPGVAGGASIPASGNRGASWRVAVGAGLSSLGWSAREAEAAMDIVQSENTALVSVTPPDIGAILKLALRALDRS